MLSILSVIPVIGPIVQSVVDLFAKKADVDLQKTLDANKTTLEKQKDLTKTDVAVIQARMQLALATHEDLGTRIIKDMVMYGVAVWMLIYFFWLSFKGLLPEYYWEVGTPPETMQYIPYAMIAYLFVTAYRGKP